MKKDLHPKSYRLVVFKDMSNDYSFLSRSTAASKGDCKMGRWQRIPAGETGDFQYIAPFLYR